MGDGPIRCFIAVPLPFQIQKSLSRVQRLLRNQPGIKGSFPQWKNLHLTLIFLGNMPYESIAILTSAMDAAAHRQSGFFLSLSGLGTFPGRNRPARILWAGIEDEVNALRRIHHSLNGELTSRGVAFDRQKLSPHITLARFKNSIRFCDLAEIISPQDVTGETFQVKSIDLYKSKLTAQGAEYTLLHSSPLR